LVEAAADEGTCEDDDEGEHDEEEARLLLQTEALRVERDEREDAAVGEEDEAAEQRGREGARLDEIRQREATLPLRRGRCDRARQTARARREQCERREPREEEEERAAAEVADDEQADERTRDHREIRREREIADALALARGRQYERSHRRGRRRREREDAAVQQAQSVDGAERVRETECEHDEQESE